MTLDEAVEQMRGRPGTPIDITIVREGQDKPLEMTLTREIIDLKPVKWEVSGDVGVLTVTNFSADATADQIGRAHVWTPVTNAHIVCRLQLEKKKNTKSYAKTTTS